MPSNISRLFSTATFRQTTITSISTFINGGLGAAFYFLLARYLGSFQYGQFSLIASGITALAGVADLGCDQGLIRFIAKNKHGSQYYSYAKLSLLIKLISGFVLFAFLYLLSPSFSQYFFHSGNFTWAVLLVGLGVITQLLFSFSVSLSQAMEKYFHWSSLLVGTNFLRLVLLIIIFSLGNLSVLSAGIIYIILPVIGFVLSLSFFSRGIWSAKIQITHFREMFSYNKWVTAFVLVTTVGSRVDLFLTAKFTNLSATGIYSLATQLVAILPQLTSAVGAVTSPKFASFTSLQQNRTYLSKSLAFTSAISLLSSAALIFITWIVLAFTGRDYVSAWIPFLVLLLSMDIFLATTPLRDSLLYYFSKPRFFFFTSFSQLIISICLGQWLIPLYGTTGAALTVLVSQIFLSVASYFYYLNLQPQNANAID